MSSLPTSDSQPVWKIKEKFPDQSAITLQTDDKVRYDVLERINDECLGNQLPQVSVMAAG